MNPPRLLLVAHGTRSAAGQREIAKIATLVQERLLAEAHMAVEIRQAWVDVVEPAPEVVLADGRPTVVIPAFLARGYHVVEDIAAAVVSAPGPVVETAHLGNEPEIRRVLCARLAEAFDANGVSFSQLSNKSMTAVVLAFAGSRDPGAVAEVSELARDLSEALGVVVIPGFASAATPTVAEAVAELRAGGHTRVAIATHLLAPGFFADRIAEAGADITSAPLGAAPEIVELIARRYREAIATTRQQSESDI